MHSNSSTVELLPDFQVSIAGTKMQFENSVASHPRFYRLRHTLGFRNNYDFVLWMIVSSSMAFFTFIRLPYLHPPTFQTQSSPGEWYYLRHDPYHFGIFLHLFTVLPAGFLAIFQFIPAIRTKFTYIHTLVGYTVMTLLFFGNIGVMIICRKAMGGDMSLQVAILYLTISTTGAMYLAWHNIKCHQIDQHRKWMLRAMFQMSIIVTMRIVLSFMVLYLSWDGAYFSLWSCDQILFVTGNTTEYYANFPACRLGAATLVGVPAGIHSPLHIGSAIRIAFAAATWVAIVLHTLGVEIYIHLTPMESERLRILSYYKQKANGLQNPGSAGITSDRWGDGLTWNPPKKVVE